MYSVWFPFLYHKIATVIAEKVPRKCLAIVSIGSKMRPTARCIMLAHQIIRLTGLLREVILLVVDIISRSVCNITTRKSSQLQCACRHLPA